MGAPIVRRDELDADLKKLRKDFNAKLRTAGAGEILEADVEVVEVDVVTREDLEAFRADLEALDARLEDQGLTIAKLVDYVELPESYELEETDEPEDPAQDPEGTALVEAIIERKAAAE